MSIVGYVVVENLVEQLLDTEVRVVGVHGNADGNETDRFRKGRFPEEFLQKPRFAHTVGSVDEDMPANLGRVCYSSWGMQWIDGFHVRHGFNRALLGRLAQLIPQDVVDC